MKTAATRGDSMRRAIFAVVVVIGLFVQSTAFAGSGTITVLDSANSIHTYDVITDSGGRYISMFGVCDGTAAAQCAAVKPPNTAAVAGDPSLVVSVSPNNSVAITPFVPAAYGTPISVTTASSTATLPTGAVVVASNAGTTNVAYCALGATASTTDVPIQPGSWFAFSTIGNTQISCITSTGTTTVNTVGGSGVPVGAGGGGGGGGGGGAITVADGADTALGSTTDAPCSLPLSATACTQIGATKALVNIANSPVPFPNNRTPHDCSGSITTGGTAQNAFTAQTTLTGGWIINITTATTDTLWGSWTGTAAANSVGSFPLVAPPSGGTGGSFTFPAGAGLNTALSIYGATTGDKWTCTWYD
jgi:hypothetical protein